MRIEFDVPAIVNLGDPRYCEATMDVRLKATVTMRESGTQFRLGTAKVVPTRYLKEELRCMYHDIIDDAFKKMPKMVRLE